MTKLLRQPIWEKPHYLFAAFIAAILGGEIGSMAMTAALPSSLDAVRPVFDTLLMAAFILPLGYLLHLRPMRAHALATQRSLRVLEDSEERLRTHFESAFEGIVIHEEGRILDVNPALARMFGYENESESLIGQSILDYVDEESREMVMGNVLAGRIPQCEMACLKRDGSSIRVEISGKTQAFQGRSARVIAVRDITERNRWEQQILREKQRLDDVTVHAKSGLLLLDEEGRVDYANRLAEEWFGPLGDIKGKICHELYSADDSATRCSAFQAIATGEQASCDIFASLPNGKKRFFYVVATPIKDDDGKVIQVTQVVVDITERKRHEQKLASLLAISSAVRVASTHTERLPIVLDQVMGVMDAEGAAISLRDPQNGETIQLGRGTWSARSGRRITPSDEPEEFHRYTQAATLADGGISIGVTEEDESYEHVTFIPLIAQEHVIGSLWVATDSPVHEKELELLTAVADIAASAIHRATLREQTQLRLDRMTAMRTIDSAITSSRDLAFVSDVLLSQVTSQLNIDAATILVLNPETLLLKHVANRGFRLSKVDSTSIRLGEGLAGRAAIEERSIGSSAPQGLAADASRALLAEEEGFASYLALPLMSKGEVRGVLELFHRSRLSLDPESHDYLRTLAGQAAIAIENASLFTRMQRSNVQLRLAYDTTLEGWSRALDLRDKETEGHTQRVAEMSVKLAVAMGVPEDELIHIKRGALLHDIGKMGIPDSILLKPGPLTDEEWRVMRKHPQLAYDLLSPIPFLRHALEIPHCHHERWDGSGYPLGLQGEQIPLSARIFAAVDVWDAMTSDRPYRQALEPEEVLEHIISRSDTHFDPRIVRAFAPLLDGSLHPRLFQEAV